MRFDIPTATNPSTSHVSQQNATAGWRSFDACAGGRPRPQRPPSTTAVAAAETSCIASICCQPNCPGRPGYCTGCTARCCSSSAYSKPYTMAALAPSNPQSPSQRIAATLGWSLHTGDRCCRPCRQLQLVQRLQQQAASLHCSSCCCLRPCSVTPPIHWPLLLPQPGLFKLWLLLLQALQLAPARTAALAAPPAAGGCAGWSPAAPCWRLCCCPTARLP